MSRAIVNLFGGEQVDLLAPSWHKITVAAIVAGSRQPRVNAHTTEPVTIADHSCRAAACGLLDGCSLEVAAALLLHDAAEPLLGDPPGPLKHAMMLVMPDGETISWTDLENRWLREVCQAILPEPLVSGVLAVLQDQPEVVKRYDNIALGLEAMAFLDGPTADWALDLVGRSEGRARYAVAWERRDDAEDVFAAAIGSLHSPNPLRALSEVLLGRGHARGL
jgi:hypothetical protein